MRNLKSTFLVVNMLAGVVGWCAAASGSLPTRRALEVCRWQAFSERREELW